MSLLEAMTTPPCTPAEQPSIAEEDRVGSSARGEGARGTSPALGTAKEVTSKAPVVLARLSTTTLPPEDGLRRWHPLAWMMLGLSLHMGLRG